MSTNSLKPLADPEDMFAETRMSFGDHIEELRSHLFRAIYGFVIGMVLCILPPVGPFALKFITKPVEDQLVAFYNRFYANKFAELEKNAAQTVPSVPLQLKVHLPTLKGILAGKSVEIQKDPDAMVNALGEMLARLGMDSQIIAKRSADPEWVNLPVELPDPTALAKAMTDINRSIRPEILTSMNVQEVFIVYIKVGLLMGLVVSSPWVFYQIWSFVAAGLYPHEKKLINVYLPFSIGLFLLGFFVCEFLALPRAVEALLWFNEWLGFQPELRLSEWLGFAIIMPLVFGISFQTPMVMLFLFKIGVADVNTFRSNWKIIYFAMAAFAAIFNPSTDVPSMLLLWVPMCILFELGILLCKLQPPNPIDDMDDDNLDEMVGV